MHLIAPFAENRNATNTRQLMLTSDEISTIVRNVCDIRGSTQTNRTQTNRAQTNRAQTNQTQTNRAQPNPAQTNRAVINNTTNEPETTRAKPGRKALPRDENGKIIRNANQQPPSKK